MAFPGFSAKTQFYSRSSVSWLRVGVVVVELDAGGGADHVRGEAAVGHAITGAHHHRLPSEPPGLGERIRVAQRMRPAQTGKRRAICGRFKGVAVVAVAVTVKAPDLDCPIVIARPAHR